MRFFQLPIILRVMLTQIGIDIPKQATLSVPSIKVVDSPTYLSRQISPIDIDSNGNLGIWGRFNGLKGRISFHHNLLNLFAPKIFINQIQIFIHRLILKAKVPLDISGSLIFQRLELLIVQLQKSSDFLSKIRQ